MTPSEQAEAWVAKTLAALKAQSRVVPTGDVAYSAWLNGHAHGLATLRDHFAMAALQGDWASLGPNEDRPESCFPKAARDYYRMADAMLAARKKET